ncbi:MAG: ribbon-helix-helix domain-containing protein [Pseudonocardiales bacterium]
MTAARITVTIPEQLARDARQAVDEGKAVSVSGYVADALRYYGRTTTLRELLDHWWAEDPAGPPSEAERAAARTALGLPETGISQ